MNAAFAWPGGKRGLKKTLLERIPDHKIYVEVFGGSAKLLFSKTPSPAEVVNDANGDIINFFRVTKHRSAELAELLEHDVVHPARFRDLETENSPDELARALRFIYRTWYSFGAKGKHFAAAALSELAKSPPGIRRPLDSVRELLEAASERLRRVRLEQRDFGEMIERFDSPETFFYLDPPYVHYKPNGVYESLAPVRREELFSALAGAKGMFLVSFDDCKEVRELAATHDMHVEEVKTRYSLNQQSNRGEITELLVSRSGNVMRTVQAGEATLTWTADPNVWAIAELFGGELAS